MINRFNQFSRILFAAGMAALALTLWARNPADMSKTLHTYLEGVESGFDPAKYSDTSSDNIDEQIFEPLLQFDYLSNPQKLVAGTADLPTALNGGRTFVFKIKPGIYFAADAAFQGKQRELVAQDYVYSLQRLVDPGNRGAPWSSLLQGKIIGLDDKVEQASKTGKFDYDKPIEGLKALDKYTLQVNLTHTDYTLPMVMAVNATSAVAREVIERYGDDSEAHPVGTGPYMLKEWEPRVRMLLTANPNYRGVEYQPDPESKGVDPAVAKEFKGKLLPRVGNLDIRVIELPQAAWVSFENGQLDILPRLGYNYVNMLAPKGDLSPRWKARGFQFTRIPIPETRYYQFNMDDPVVGGYTNEKIALRRAIAMAYNQVTEANIVRNGQALLMQSILPPGIAGYDPAIKNPLGKFDPARANALLDVFGYKIDPATGFRTSPDGRPLTITYLAETGQDGRDLDELITKAFDRIHVHLVVDTANFSDLLKNRLTGHYQFTFGAWSQDYPDATNFLPLLYGPLAGATNDTRFRNKEYDALFDTVSTMPDTPERTALIDRMCRIAEVYGPWVFAVNRIRTYLAQPWVSGFKPTPDDKQLWMYVDIDKAKQTAAHAR
ncbi:MAG: heme-binding protein [Burkholderiaceae bacterium]|nr:heme-binding protein [Burkholderiaceae bacterium]